MSVNEEGATTDINLRRAVGAFKVLFRKHSTLKVGDPIKLVCDLHKTFVACTGIDETLDHFYGWGQLLITDFDDIDKNMAEAEKLFANLSNIHELDDISYLTEEQKTLIKKFFSNFNDDHNSELKKRFLQLWSHFLDIYKQFNMRLEEQGLAYEGALYRKVVNDENIRFQHKKYLFVGFNMMQVVEWKLCDRLMKEGKAHFYWDYDDYYMQNNHEAGHYIREYLKYYPNELNDMPPQDLRDIYHNFDNNKDITYISASTENIQARYVNQWLKEKKRYKYGKKVAIVLADEGLLQSVIHSLPTSEDIKSLPDYSENDKLAYNITLGYPLQQTPFYSLLQQLIKLQGVGHPKHSNNYRLHNVLMVLRHPYTRYISQNYSKLLSALDEQKQFYPTRQFLSMDGDEGLSLLFKDLGETATENEYNLRLIQYLLDILKTPNEGLAEPRFRTVVNFIFGGSTERMRELAFGNQEVDFESKGGNEHIRRMPEIEKWAQDIYRFVSDKYGEENIVSLGNTSVG